MTGIVHTHSGKTNTNRCTFSNLLKYLCLAVLGYIMSNLKVTKST